MEIRPAIILGLVLESLVTIATSYQHHSEWQWEVGPAYFGTIIGYVLARLILWIPLGGFVSAVAYRAVDEKRDVIVIACAAFLVEVATTLLSSTLRESEPTYGIFFRSAWSYTASRLVFWVMLVGILAFVVHRRRRTA
jgi:hypothetical protein